MMKKNSPPIYHRIYRRNPGLLYVLLLIISFNLATPSTAQAYIDPGAGSALVALLAAGLTGAAVTLRIWKAKVKDFLRRDSSDKPQSDKVEPPTSSDNES